MKKVITAMTAMSLTLQANDSLNQELTTAPIQRNQLQSLISTNSILNEDLSFLVSDTNEDILGASGIFLDVDKTVNLDIDADLSGGVSAGDTLSYNIFIDNPSQVNASDLFFDDTPDINTSLVVGSTTTTHGSIQVGNNSGDEIVSVNLVNLPIGDTALVSFQVTVDQIADGRIIDLSNQGLVTSANVGFYLTDDPSVVGLTNPTVIKAFGQATILYDEIATGDLRDHFNIPTQVALSLENQIALGIVGGVGIDLEDCFQFDVSDSRVVNAVILEDFMQNGGSTSTAFKIFTGLPPIKLGLADVVDTTISENDIGRNLLNFNQLTTGSYSVCLIEETPGQVYSIVFQSDVEDNIFNNGFE